GAGQTTRALVVIGDATTGPGTKLHARMTPRRLIEPARLASTALLRGQSDARLVDLTRAGNEQAFEAIVHRYRRPLLRHCGRILPPGRAEDAVQQTFLSAYSAISSGQT